MRKGRWLSLAVVFLLVCSVFAMGITTVEVSGEENTEDRDEIEYREDDVENEEIQEIEDWDDLDDVRDDLEANYTLMNDLDEDSDGYDELVGTEDGWEPIGDYDERFNGSLNGDGFEISGLNINRSDDNYIGLFGYIGEQGSVYDFDLVDLDIIGDGLVGGGAGANSGSISNLVLWRCGRREFSRWNIRRRHGRNP